ncbi:MAG: hypothetical protein LBD37_04180 [Treponema sp.]|jgi:hypothetical protein|nr:hypothetical protein [Treponema sp.]
MKQGFLAPLMAALALGLGFAQAQWDQWSAQTQGAARPLEDIQPRRDVQVPRSNQDNEIIVYRLPDPERVYIYRNGMVVYDASIPARAVINNTFILPENARQDSLIISQAGKRIYSYTTFTAEVLVVLRSGERPNLARVLQVEVPGLSLSAPLEVKYGVRNAGLSWSPLLDMEVLDGNVLACALIAEIRSNRRRVPKPGWFRNTSCGFSG